MKTLLHGSYRLPVIAVVTLALISAGVAYATIPGPTGVINGCYAKSGGTLRVIDGTVTNCTSKETNLNWNVQGPKGDTGSAGPAGLKGDTGPAGPAGPAGLKGDTGPAGLAGAKGDTGPAGPAGPAGLKGDTGPAGPAGAKGDIGPAGPAGIAGPKGDTGPAGPAGIAGPKGDTGPAGIAGPAGPKGDTGPAGATGPSDAYNNPTASDQQIDLTSGLTAVASLNLAAGSYVFIGSTRVASTGTGTNVECVIFTFGVFASNFKNVNLGENGDRKIIALNVAGTLSAPATVNLSCRITGGDTAQASEENFNAIKVGSITNQ